MASYFQMFFENNLDVSTKDREGSSAISGEIQDPRDRHNSY